MTTVYPSASPLPEDEAFTRPALRADSLDLYTHRAAILREVTRIAKQIEGFVLDVGCGKMPYRSLLTSNSHVREYVGLDLPTSCYGTKPDLTWDGCQIPLQNECVDWALAIEVLEHCPDPLSTLTEIHRVLKPRGKFFFTVPFVWPLHEAPHDEYRYTPFALERLLRQAGFTDVDFHPLGGWNACLTQMIGLWVRRRPMAYWKRRVLSAAILPLARWLLKRDVIPQQFNNNTMISGLSGVAVSGE